MIIKSLLKKSANSYFYFITAMFSVVIFAVSLLFLINDNFSYKSSSIHEIKAQNENIRQKITDSLTYTQQIMFYVSKQISSHSPNDYKMIDQLLATYRNPQNGLLFWNVFAWVDSNYKIKVSNGMGIILEDVDVSDRNYIKLAEENPETMHVGNPVVGKLSKIDIIPLSYGILNRDRKYIGSIVAGIVINNLESQISDVISDSNILFALIAGDGKIVAQSTKLSSGKNKELLDKILVETTKHPTQEFTSDFAYYHPLIECTLECANYGLITIYDNDTTLHRNITNWTIHLLIAFFAISIAGFMFFGFHKNIINPLAVLAKSSRKIQHNDLNGEMPEFEIREISQIADSLTKIDQMLWHKNDK